MKSIREILLARHAAALPDLDDLRRRTLAKAFPESRPMSPGPGLWYEIFGRARAAWIGIAATALVALGLNLATPTFTPVPASNRPIDWTTEARREQTHLLADLLAAPAPHAEPASPRVSPAPPPTKHRSSLDHSLSCA